MTFKDFLQVSVWIGIISFFAFWGGKILEYLGKAACGC